MKMPNNPSNWPDLLELLQSWWRGDTPLGAVLLSVVMATQTAMDFILGADNPEQTKKLTGWLGEIATYYAAAPVRLGGAKVPHLMPGDSLNLQSAQNTDNGYSVFEQSLLRYIAAGLGVSYEQLSVRAVLDTEAAVFSGQESIDHGLADELVNSTDAIGVMRSALDTKKTIHIGGMMKTTTTNAAATQPDTNAAPGADGVIATAPAAPAAAAPEQDVSAQVSAAVSAESARIMGILNCEAASGREEQARALAETPGMTVEHAQRILAAAPQSSQTRSETALDRLMETAPDTLASGAPAASETDDLMNTPV